MGICQSKLYIDDIYIDDFKPLKQMKLIKRNKKIINNESIYDIYIKEYNKVSLSFIKK